MENILTTVWLNIFGVAILVALADFGLIWLADQLSEEKYEFRVRWIVGQWAALSMTGLTLTAALNP